MKVRIETEKEIDDHGQKRIEKREYEITEKRDLLHLRETGAILCEKDGSAVAGLRKGEWPPLTSVVIGKGNIELRPKGCSGFQEISNVSIKLVAIFTEER